MTEHNTHDVVGHEETDADIGPLVRFAIFLAVLTLATAALTVGFYRFLDSREQAAKAPRYPLAEGVTRPFDDVKAFRVEEAKLLDHYAWIDKNAGTVRIPVSRAIELLAAKGLPHREAPPAAATPAAPVAAPAAPAAPATHAPAH